MKNKKVGLDIFWFLHQSKGDMFYLQNFVLPIIKNADKVHCIFDGKPSPDKLESLQEQANKRREIEKSISEIETFLKYPFNKLTNSDRVHIQLYLQHLRKQAWVPSRDYINNVKAWLISKGCIIHQASSDADNYLIHLEKEGIIDTIVTNDSDLLIYGSKNLVRLHTPFKGLLYNVDNILPQLGFTYNMWDNFLYLCQHMAKKDIALAFTLVSIYKDIDYILQKYYTLYETNIKTPIDHVELYRVEFEDYGYDNSLELYPDII